MSNPIRLFAVLLSMICAVPVLAGDAPPSSAGQTVYVPIYSHVLHGNQDRRGKPEEWLLSAMLSIRNTDVNHGMTVRSVVYYDTEGKLLRSYLTEPRKLGPLATIEFFVENRDKSGGSGANFLVAWDAEKSINPPIIEAVHTNFYGSQSVAFITEGRVLQTAKEK